MSKRAITLSVLVLSACLGWYISATYVDTKNTDAKTELPDISMATSTAPFSTSTTPKDNIDPKSETEPTSVVSIEPVEPTPTPKSKGGCYVGGCSNQVCSESKDLVSTCEWRAEYACYQTASCERQSDGQCGWTESEELNQCLNTSATQFIPPQVN